MASAQKLKINHHGPHSVSTILSAVLRKSARVIYTTTHVSVFRHARVPEVVILMPSTSGHHSETLAQSEWWTQHYQHSCALLHHNTGMNVSEPTAETNRYEQERRHRH